MFLNTDIDKLSPGSEQMMVLKQLLSWVVMQWPLAWQLIDNFSDQFLNIQLLQS